MPSPVPSAQSLGSFAVFHTTTGQFLHVLSVDLMPGAIQPSTEDIHGEAVASVTHQTNIPSNLLGVLPIGHTVLTPGTSFRVNPATQTLEQS